MRETVAIAEMLQKEAYVILFRAVRLVITDSLATLVGACSDTGIFFFAGTCCCFQ